ncbi:MAG: GldG family protein [Parcubacteria group bacterium]|nr:GldG family protein [Parcubacteria group bacterium]
MDKKTAKKIKKFLKFQWLLKFFGMRQTKYGSNALLAVVAMLGILILVNYIARKESFDWDLTKNHKFTLADQTEKVLQGVEEEIKVIGFFRGGNPAQEEVKGLLEQYRNQNSNITVEFIDPDTKPTVAREYGIERYGTLVFEKGDKREQSLTTTESDITSSILKLTRETQKKIYFLTGHKEKGLKDVQETGYSVVNTLLSKEGYEVAELSLVATREVPEDAAVLVIAGPQDKILDEEKEIISQYLDNDGKLLALLDPVVPGQGKASNLEDLLQKWGVTTKEGVIVDPKEYFWTDISTPVVKEWQTHQITDGLQPAFFPGVKSVGEADEHPENTEITTLASTSDNSWLEKNLSSQEAKFNEDIDEKGPLPVAVVVKGVVNNKEGEENTEEDQESKTRLIVVGDSDFASSMFSDALGNFDFFINAVNWLAEEEELISIRPKEEVQRTVTLTGSQTKLIFYATVVGMPLIVIIIGIGVWLDRRKRKKQA